MPTSPQPAQPQPDPGDIDLLGVPGGLRPELWQCPPPEHAGQLSPALARRLLDTFTQPGDIVIDIDNDAAFAAAADQMRRRHHALRGDRQLASLGHAAGYLDLLLLHWPRPEVNPRWLLVACAGLLADGGHLVIAVTGRPRQRTAWLSALTGAARTAGLYTAVHVVAVEAVAAPQPRSGFAAPLTPHTDLLVLARQGRDD